VLRAGQQARQEAMRAEAQALAGDPGDRAEAQAVLAFMGGSDAWWHLSPAGAAQRPRPRATGQALRGGCAVRRPAVVDIVGGPDVDQRPPGPFPPRNYDRRPRHQGVGWANSRPRRRNQVGRMGRPPQPRRTKSRRPSPNRRPRPKVHLSRIRRLPGRRRAVVQVKCPPVTGGKAAALGGQGHRGGVDLPSVGQAFGWCAALWGAQQFVHMLR